MSRLEADMINKVKRDLHQTKDPMERLRLMCLSRGITGILDLVRIFRKMAVNEERVDEEKFIKKLQGMNFEITEDECKEIFKRFAAEGTGLLNLDDFLATFRPSIPEIRQKTIDAAFKKLDRSGDGKLSLDDFKSTYNVHNHNSYKNGQDTEEEIIIKFLNNFERENLKSGSVTKEEFKDYYLGVSSSIDNDIYFDLMMRQTYKL